MAETTQDRIDKCNIQTLPQDLQKLRDVAATAAGVRTTLGFGAMLAAMRPRNRTRSGLSSNATQVHDEAAIIYAVQTPVGTPLAMISGGSPGAGEVSVDYDATTGVPTLIFNGAVTTYTVHSSGPLPQSIAAVMASLA